MWVYEKNYEELTLWMIVPVIYDKLKFSCLLLNELLIILKRQLMSRKTNPYSMFKW